MAHNKPETENTALASVLSKPARPVCSNCKCPTHRTEYCISPGGQMAGKSIDKARAAQEAARATQRTGGIAKAACNNRGTNTQSQSSSGDTKSIMVNGKCYTLVDNSTSTPEATTENAMSAISVPMPAYNEEEYIAVIATAENPFASLDWGTHSCPRSSVTMPIVAYPAGHSPIRSDDLPFILDTGATCHISPKASDFKDLRSIPCHPVKGLCGSAIYTMGIGNIELRIAGGHTLKLVDALYIPDSSVRLISILALNKSGNYTTYFDSDGCWVTNKSNTTLVRGALSNLKRLYVLSAKTPYVQHQKQPKPPASTTALYTRVPDIKTWHCQLGHCNNRSIVDMARMGVTQGMPIDLSLLPANCDHCTISKQSHSPIPKVQEGVKSDRHLGRVYADVCGPMAINSCARNVYALNMIDDFSSYVWSVPLRSKADASTAFQTWHKAVTVQSRDTLHILITDNGELVSNSMTEFCNIHRIDHQLTAPYTSAQNGHAERLHRTLAGKARTMHLSCNAPAFLWDEFFATAAYLTNLTAATANKGRTPYELWFS
jgi:hypothetical protein